MAALRTAFALAAASTACVALPPAAAESHLHHVRYTITAVDDAHIKVFYRDVDPASWAEYSHNPYASTPQLEIHLLADQTWSRDVMLNDPDAWATVVARSSRPVGLHCSVYVDDVKVHEQNQIGGVNCSVRAP